MSKYARGGDRLRKLAQEWRRFAAIGGGIMLIVASIMIWNNYNRYPRQALAEKYYQSPTTGHTIETEATAENDYLNLFADAHQAMQVKDYDRARLLFERLITTLPPAGFSDDDVKYYQDNLDWNLILTLLEHEDSGQALQQRLSVILASPDHTYFSKAKALQDDLR